MTLNNFAGLYQSRGRYAEAEPLYRRSLTIRESAHSTGLGCVVRVIASQRACPTESEFAERSVRRKVRELSVCLPVRIRIGGGDRRCSDLAGCQLLDRFRQ